MIRLLKIYCRMGLDPKIKHVEVAGGGEGGRGGEGGQGSGSELSISCTFFFPLQTVPLENAVF